ncbi:hypothetical protein FF011L_54410 [Roseimaritima multifibrata]|uniref:Uncharacterized protein n=1 Tax=Roseimaritima multifibrata TaxID=1930274 RepID=A0A517MP24_9BACT|nr:hypothetical protein FF011L_54410 [Roseimaritima multifibrata]
MINRKEKYDLALIVLSTSPALMGAVKEPETIKLYC